ncbi:hypothetical protein McanCB56680_005009, partial [Microsporum canis]
MLLVVGWKVARARDGDGDLIAEVEASGTGDRVAGYALKAEWMARLDTRPGNCEDIFDP